MHRDLKPENIMFKEKDKLDSLVIVDFGLAEIEDELPYLFNKCGTPGYVAPEIANYQEKSENGYSGLCDVFSAGIIFYTLLFYKSLFIGKKFNEVLKLNKECNINFLDKSFQDLPFDTLDLLQKMLEKNPSNRISAEDALKHSYFKNEKEKRKTQKQQLGSIQQLFYCKQF
ncbi:protein kinase domain protein [Ichthyophthirius multifiliis]|uniref:Protein kinase domain protein n=1 Tax=Ichthyophthirius multifiliis TaxID=5932 RepID=G0QRT8_ICHMU|nr:protein kinase domain protein [Ichthyophthirius multifiliis]EGR32072.1 protein kinase domain protein [Ichthyophthirius multifiliis]|eukprot:XP_004035558.1 protein kinase domain protein [Ichthyophthirius multifiliis]